MISRSHVKKLMKEYIQESLTYCRTQNDRNLFQSWHTSQELGDIHKRTNLVEYLWSENNLHKIYEKKENISKTVSSFLNFYAIESQDFSFNEKLFSKFFNFFWRELTHSERICKIVFPLSNFHVSEELRLDKEFRIVPFEQSGKVIDIEERFASLLGRLSNKSVGYLDGQMKMGKMPVGALLIQTFKEKKEPADYFCMRYGNLEASKRSMTLLQSLRLFKAGDIELDLCYTNIVSWFSIGVPRGFSFVNANPFGQKFSLSKSELHALKKFRHCIEPYFLNTGRDAQIDIALDFFNFSYLKLQEEERIIELMISIEALFGTRSEAKYRIALRMANFLAKLPDKKKQIFQDIKELYDLRSALVHGSRPKKKNGKTYYSKEELKAKRQTLENYVRDSLVLFINLRRNGVKVENFEENVILNKKISYEKYICR